MGTFTITVYYTMFLYSVKPVGGILFGIAFWRMSKFRSHANQELHDNFINIR